MHPCCSGSVFLDGVLFPGLDGACLWLISAFTHSPALIRSSSPTCCDLDGNSRRERALRSKGTRRFRNDALAKTANRKAGSGAQRAQCCDGKSQNIKSEKGEVLLTGVGALRYYCLPNASVQWQPGDLTIHTKKWFWEPDS